MSYKVKAYSIERLVLNETDRVKSVLQNIAVILSTFKGSAPMHRNIGVNPDILDKPIRVAKTMMVADVIEAIESNEPRARVKSVTFDADSSDPGKLIPVVEVEIDES